MSPEQPSLGSRAAPSNGSMRKIAELRHPSFALLSVALLAGCVTNQVVTRGPGGTGDETTNDPSGVTPGIAGAVGSGGVGIWQQTAAAGGDFTNTVTGESFTMSQGFSARLKLRANGQYTFEHYSSGTSGSCAAVSALDKSEGTAQVSEGRLVLTPTTRTLDVKGCEGAGLRTLPNDPIAFDATITTYETLIKETTLLLELSGGPYPLKLRLLNPEPSPDVTSPAQPPSFQLGADGPYTELLGTWAPSQGSDLGFYDPASGATYVPEYNGAEHRWLRFTDGGYEMATSFENAGGADSGVCKKDLVYYERGRALFAKTSQENDRIFGDARFAAEEARLVVTIRACDEDDGTKTYDLKPLTSYFKWEWTPSVGFNLGCEYPKHPHQFAACTNDVGWNSLKKR